MNFDRRRSLRLPIDLTVQWRRGWRHVMTRAHDMNANGLFFLTTEEVPVNHLLELVVTMPTGPITFTAVSRFCGKSKFGAGIGCEIHVIAPAERDVWMAYYRQRLAQAMRALPPELQALLGQ